MSDQLKLKPCPLCCDPTLNNFEIYFHDNFHMVDEYKAGCGRCGCSTPIFKTKMDAAFFWNNRQKLTSNHHCPLCNKEPELLEYKIRQEQILPFYKYQCNNCGFSSGISKDKSLIVRSWIENRPKL